MRGIDTHSSVLPRAPPSFSLLVARVSPARVTRRSIQLELHRSGPVHTACVKRKPSCSSQCIVFATQRPLTCARSLRWTHPACAWCTYIDLLTYWGSAQTSMTVRARPSQVQRRQIGRFSAQSSTFYVRATLHAARIASQNKPVCAPANTEPRMAWST